MASGAIASRRSWRKFSPIVEMVSIDEAYLDLAGTERLHGPPLAAADKLLRAITSTTGLPCSAGLGSTRLVAKVGSDQAKPRGLVWIAPGSEAQFLAPLPVRKIPGIGEVTERSLLALGLKTVGDLAAVPHEKLQKIFGQWGTALYRKARGGDSYEFVIDAEPKSISHNHTFGEDTNDTEVLLSMLSHLSQKACKRLREAGLSTRTLTLTIRYQGFDTYTRAKTLPAPTNLDSEFSPRPGSVSRTPKPEAKSALARRRFGRVFAWQRSTRLARWRKTRETRETCEGYRRAPGPVRVRFGAIWRIDPA